MHVIRSALAEHLAQSPQAWASLRLAASYFLHRLLPCLAEVGTLTRRL
jgi:hypothetical protein